jgi:ribosome biogenesis GTPase
MNLIRGIVLRSQSGFYDVETEEGMQLARMRGRLKNRRKMGDIVALGDWVRLSIEPDGQAMIEEVEPRVRALVRQSPRPQGIYEQVILANPDQALFMFACAEPKPKLRMLDRFLVAAEQQNIPAGIVANKIDLVGMKAAKEIFGYYADIGYPIYYTSVKNGKGIRDLQDALKDKVSVLAGPSGVGKSSLLNAIQPELGIRVKEVSKATAKGKHTTVERKLFPLNFGGYVADTPGMKAFALHDIEPEELDGYFPEISALVPDCKFRNCQHLYEPGCAVRAGVESGSVHPARYDSFLRLRRSYEED